MWSDERLDSKSIASKILCKALPNTNNSACASTSRAESKADTESVANLKSSLLDSYSHGHFLDSQNLVFAQKKKGYYPLPALSKPRKSRRFFGSHKVYLLAGEPRFSLSRQNEVSLEKSANEVSLEKSAVALLPPFS